MNDRPLANPYTLLGETLVRTPLLPIEAYAQDASATPRADWVDAAIAVGSLSLATARRSEGAEAARLRYRLRMTTRPTPYGLFAGVALARWDEPTTLALADCAPVTRTRPDMGWLLRLVMELESRRDVRRGLLLRTNPAALVRGERVMLAERQTYAGDGVAPPRVSVRATAATLLVLRLARNAIAFSDLIDAVIQAAPNVASGRVEGLVHELIDQSLMLTDLRPPLTCESPAAWVVERLEQADATRTAGDKLSAFLRAASHWDSLPALARGPAYFRLAQAARELGAKPDEPPVQVDTCFALSGDRISRAVGEEVARAAWLMLRLTPIPRGFPYLKNYHQAFVARYGEHREIPLLELLDPYWGLGPPDLNANAGWIEFQRRDRTLLDLASRALRDRQLVIDLDETTISRLETWRDEPGPLPASLDVCAFVCARPGGIERGEFSVVVGPNVGSAAAGRNLGRFADLLGEAGQRALRSAHAAASARGVLVAELVYLPRTFRLANVAIRPAVTQNEISVGLAPGVAPDHNIPLDELVVGVEEGRFYLRWQGHADRVVVTSSHMLNFNEAHPICRFLAHLGADFEAQLHVFDWGPASAFPFLPRVQSGRAVLRPAEWRIGGSLGPEVATAEAFRAFLRAQRSEWWLPRHVYLSSGDVRLLLDLDDDRHTEQLRREVRRVGPDRRVVVQEALPGLEDAWLTGPGGHYVVELVVSMARSATVEEAPALPLAAGRTVAPRMIPVGGQWLYLKLYGSAEAEDDLLTGPIAAFVDRAKAAGFLRDCFFLRYSDPQPHLRIRFRTPRPADAERLLLEVCALGQSLMEHEWCERFALDTYEREIERYGGPRAIDHAEDVFVADSAFVLSMLRLAKASEVDRKVIAAVSALEIVDDLAFDASLARDLAARLRSCWVEAGPEYRTVKAKLLPLIDDPRLLSSEPGGDEFLVLRQRRRQAVKALGRQLRKVSAAGELAAPAIDVCHSLLHMHCNRLLGRDRTEERLVLGLMLRAQDARRARQSAGRVSDD